MRIAIASLLQETNTFSPQATRRDQFIITPTRDLLVRQRNENAELQGFADALEKAGAEIVPVFSGWAVSYGRITTTDFHGLVKEITDGLRAAGPVDGVLLALHGAWAAEGIDSADGFVLQAVRQQLGPQVSVVITLDLHANLTRSMWQTADPLIAYRTCPHTDLRTTGQRAGEMLLSMLRREIRPSSCAVKIPMVVQAEHMMSDRGEFREILEHARSLEAQPRVLAASLFAVQPWLDVEELGWSALVITDNDPTLAKRLARELAGFAWARRRTFVISLPNVDEALDEAMKAEGGPVVIGEGADGTMGGAPGDGTSLIDGVLRKRLDVTVAAVVVDPEAAHAAARAGVGKTVTLDVGGKLDPTYARSVHVTGRVKLISDGVFHYKGRCYNGREVNMGMGVVLQVGKMSLLISERPVTTTDPELYRSHGIEPRDMKLVFVKSPLAMRTEYEPISKKVLIVNSPGCCSPNLLSLPFQRRPRPMFPFEEFEFLP